LFNTAYSFSLAVPTSSLKLLNDDALQI